MLNCKASCGMQCADPCCMSCCTPCKCCCHEREDDCSGIRIHCTAAYELYFEKWMNHSGQGQIPRAFSTNDGNGPYTVLSAEFTGIQQAVYDLDVAPLGEGRYRIRGLFKPYLIVNYQDGNGTERSKFLFVNVAFDENVYVTDDITDIDIYSLFKSGIASNLLYDAEINTLTLNYELQTLLLGIKADPEKFGVVGDRGHCRSLGIREHRILKLNTLCHADTAVLSSAASIPFSAMGTAPYTLSNFEFARVKPNLLAITKNAVNLVMNLSFPVDFTLTSSDGVVTEQTSALFVMLMMNSQSDLEGSQYLLNLIPELISQPVVSGNVIRASVKIQGSVSNVETAPVQVKAAAAVDCGPVSCCNCDITGTTTTTRG